MTDMIWAGVAIILAAVAIAIYAGAKSLEMGYRKIKRLCGH